MLKNSPNLSEIELILTDNASSDETLAYFNSFTQPKTIVIRNEKNLGFNEPNNYALTQATGKFFITLNNDAEVPKGWLKHLEQPFKEFETAAISGPTGSCCSLNAPYPSFHGSVGSNFEYVEGSCLCIQSALARRHGLFATYLHFAYGEDVDLSLRMRALGYTIHQVPFQIKHQRSSTSKIVPGIADFQKKNHAAMIRRWGNYHKFRKFDLPFVIKRTAALGDVLLTTPLIRAIRKQSPKSEIFVETAVPQIFERNPDITAAGPAFPRVYRWANMVNLDMSYENMYQTHYVDAYFKTACFMSKDWHPTIYPTDADIHKGAALLSGGRWCALHAGPTQWPGRDWPEGNWRGLAVTLMDQGWKIVLVGAPGFSIPHYLDMRGRTSIFELAGLLKACELFIGIDSFPIHVAQAMSTPVIGLFGTSTPEFVLSSQSRAIGIQGQAPCAGDRHRIMGVTKTTCDGACMRDIQIDQVLDAVRNI